MSTYTDMQQQMAKGWNTWNVRSVTSHVLLPEGFALNLALREYQAGRYLKDALIGRYQGDPGFTYRGGELVEVITPGPHAYDGSYTELSLAWRDIEIIIQTATEGDDLVMLVTPGAGRGQAGARAPRSAREPTRTGVHPRAGGRGGSHEGGDRGDCEEHR